MGKTILNLDVWGGLGDNLQLSTIPRRFFEKYGYKGVYISNSSPWRNSEIKQLVWDHNPYIGGYTDKKGFHIVENGLVRFDGATNWIQNMEKIYNFDPPYNIRPEIYYKIDDTDKFKVSNSVVLDMSYSSESYERNMGRYPNMLSATKNKLQELFKQLNPNTSVTVIYQPAPLNNVNFFEKLNLDIPFTKITVDSLFDYCNIIKHCKQYVCSHSGCHALAAAIRKSCICVIPENYFHMKYFVFDNIKYLTF
jgi:hypothetical protein